MLLLSPVLHMVKALDPFMLMTTCTGSEMNVLQCPYDDDTSDCVHSDDAGIQCQRESEIATVMENQYLNTFLHFQ